MKETNIILWFGLFALISFSIFILLSRRKIKQAAKLETSVQQEIDKILTSRQPYQINVSSSHIIKVFLALILPLFFIYLGYEIKGLILINIICYSIGLLILMLGIITIIKLLTAPFIIYIDRHKISHYWIGSIEFKDITDIYLSVFEQKSYRFNTTYAKSFTLELRVKNFEKYEERFNKFEKKLFNIIKNNKLNLNLPTSEFNARVVTGVIEGIAKNSSSNIDAKLEEIKKLRNEINYLVRNKPSETYLVKIESKTIRCDTLQKEIFEQLHSQREGNNANYVKSKTTLKMIEIILALAIFIFLAHTFIKKLS